MIYFLPERIYNYILENKISDVLDKLNALSDKYNSFTTFEEYIKYSSLFIENEDNKKVYADIKSSIKEALRNKPNLLQEFEIISKDFIGEEYIHNIKALDDENYLALLIAFIDFNDSNKKCIVACHEMPFTVMTFKCIAENETQLGRYRSESDADPAALIGSHMNQISKNEKGSGIYWFSRLLESSGVKLCFGGHKHTYALSHPIKEKYSWTYNGVTKDSGTEIKLDGEEYTIVSQSDILAIVE